MYCSAFGICVRFVTTRRRVSVEFVRDLSWFGNAGMSMIWIGASSWWKVPSCGWYVVKL